MKDIIGKLYTVEVNDEKVDCLVDVLFDQSPFEVAIKLHEINGDKIGNTFTKEYLSDIVSKIHELIYDELAERRQSKTDHYEEHDR